MSDRWDEMEETRKLIEREMESFYRFLEPYQLFLDAKLEKYCFHLLRRRMKTHPLRAFFIRKIVEYSLEELGKTPDDHPTLYSFFTEKLGFILEVVLVIQYLHNQILDGKYGVTTIQDINRNLIAGNILREILFKYIWSETGVYAGTVSNTVAEIFLLVDLGQRIDKELNHYEAYQKNEWALLWENGLDTKIRLDCIQPVLEEVKSELSNKAEFVDFYFKRIYLTNVSLFTYSTQVTLQLLNVEGELKENILDFSSCYGLVVQVVNDVIDFSPPHAKAETVGKKSTDAYSDLRNKNITLPLIYHLEKGYNRLIERYLNTGDKSIIENYPLEITKEIKESGLRKAQRVGRKIAKQATTFLNDQNTHTRQFKHMLAIANWNGYYARIRKTK